MINGFVTVHYAHAACSQHAADLFAAYYWRLFDSLTRNTSFLFGQLFVVSTSSVAMCLDPTTTLNRLHSVS